MKLFFQNARLTGFMLTLLMLAFPARAQRDYFSPGYDFSSRRDDGSKRYFRLGAIAGLSLKADFSVGNQFDISRSQPGPAGVSGVDHFYDDGYVRVDQTGNAQGYTSFWGYDNAGQLSGDTLKMHSTRSFTADAGASSKGDGEAIGAELVYGGLPWRHNDARIGWEFGFGWLPISIDAHHELNGIAHRTVHSFNTGSIIKPTAPYAGGSSGIGPTIHDVATDLPDDEEAEIAASLAGQQTLDADLFIFRLGPTMQWELGSRLALSVSAGAAVGFLAGDLEFNDTLNVSDGSSAQNNGSESDSDFAFGAYLSGTLMFHVEEHGDLYLSLQYLPMSSFTIEGGGRRAEMDMMGSVFISAGINWTF